MARRYAWSSLHVHPPSFVDRIRGLTDCWFESQGIDDGGIGDGIRLLRWMTRCVRLLRSHDHLRGVLLRQYLSADQLLLLLDRQRTKTPLPT